MLRAVRNMFLLQANKYGFLGNVNLHPSVLVVWSAMYNRFDTGLLPRENINDVTLSTMEHVGILEAHLASLQSVCIFLLKIRIFITNLFRNFTMNGSLIDD